MPAVLLLPRGVAPIGIPTYSMQLPAKNDVPPEVWFAAAGMELTRHRGYPYNWCAPCTNITRGITLRALSRGIWLGFDLSTDIRHLPY